MMACRRFFTTTTAAFRAKPTVMVAMSGGVDSSVAAAQLVAHGGYDVRAVYMRNWSAEDEVGECHGEQDYRDVQAVCRQLKIPCQMVNFEKEYWNFVFQVFLDKYSKGLTPNPDILCNRFIKFSCLLDYALHHLKADKLVTGHYVRTRIDDITGETLLLRGEDKTKDQSFFLSNVSSESLQHCLFPLGHLTKATVRQMAREAGLVTADKIGSKGICFIGKRRKFSQFLHMYIDQRKGPIKLLDGTVIAEHSGIGSLTVGQSARIPSQLTRYFVAGKDVASNTIYVVDNHSHPALMAKQVICRRSDWVWVSPKRVELLRKEHPVGMSCLAQICNQHEPTECVLQFEGSNMVFHFDKPLRAAAPGQYLAMYVGEVCLGAGEIAWARTLQELPVPVPRLDVLDERGEILVE